MDDDIAFSSGLASFVKRPIPSAKLDNGMTLRDYFAGQALSSMRAGDFQGGTWAESMARQAYITADAMIGERDK